MWYVTTICKVVDNVMKGEERGRRKIGIVHRGAENNEMWDVAAERERTRNEP